MSGSGASPQLNRYQQIIERVFLSRVQPGHREVAFDREDLVRAAQQVGVDVPKNLEDILYTFRYRAAMPSSISRSDRSAWSRQWIARGSTTQSRISPS